MASIGYETVTVPVQTLCFSYKCLPEKASLEYASACAEREIQKLWSEGWILGNATVVGVPGDPALLEDYGSFYVRVRVNAIHSSSVPTGLRPPSPEFLDRGAYIRFNVIRGLQYNKGITESVRDDATPVAPPRQWRIIEKGKV